MKTRNLLLSSLCAGMLSAGLLPAQVLEIPIPNFSFELDPDLSDHPTDWDTPWPAVDARVYNLAPGGSGDWFGYSAVQGEQVVGLINGGTMMQELTDTYMEGYTYTLTFHMRNWWEEGNPTWAVAGLQAEGAGWIAYQEAPANLTEWVTYTASYTVLPGDPIIGKNIIISAQNYFMEPKDFQAAVFDAFELTASPVPEPSTAAMALAAGVGFMLLLRRRAVHTS